MRILIYGLSGYKLAGIETFLLNMNKHMSDNCIFDYVVERKKFNSDSTIHESEIKKKGGKIYYIDPKKKFLKNIKGFKEIIKKNKTEYSVVYFNIYSLSWFYPILLSKRNGLTVFVHAHNNMLHDCNIIIRLLHQLGKKIVSRMNINRLTNSNLSSQFMFGDTKREILINNAIYLKRFEFNKSTREKVRTELNLINKHVYGFAGRIAYQKNPLLLLEIFDLIQKKDKQAFLLVAGDGDLMSDLKSSIIYKGLERKVKLLGSISNIDIYYQAMDVFLLPSRFEGLGIVLIEAQAMGLPCITSSNVVPCEAKVTDLLDFVPYDNINLWVEKAIEKASCAKKRENYNSLLANTGYDITYEAKRLERILTQQYINT